MNCIYGMIFLLGVILGFLSVVTLKTKDLKTDLYHQTEIKALTEFVGLGLIMFLVFFFVFIIGAVAWL